MSQLAKKNMTEKAAWVEIKGQWNTFSDQKKFVIKCVSIIVLLLVIWFILIAPARRSIKRFHQEEPKMLRNLSYTKALQAEANAVKGKSTLSQEDAMTNIKQLTASELQNGAQVGDPSGGTVIVTLQNVKAKDLSEWIHDVRINAHSVPSQINLSNAPSSQVQGRSSYTGTVTFLLPTTP